MTDPNLVALQASRTAPPKRIYRRGRQVCRYCEAQLGALARARGVCDDRECRKKDRRLRDQIRRERDEIEMAAMRAAAAKAVKEEARLMERLRSDASRELTARDPAAPVLETSDIATTCHTTTPLVDLTPDFFHQPGAAIETVGMTRAKSSPVAGRTGKEMNRRSRRMAFSSIGKTSGSPI